jgi:hypothetical protein
MEGLSDYFEPPARALVGRLTAGEVWKESNNRVPTIMKYIQQVFDGKAFDRESSGLCCLQSEKAKKYV